LGGGGGHIQLYCRGGEGRLLIIGYDMKYRGKGEERKQSATEGRREENGTRKEHDEEKK
jgi:hypothetical protein